MTYEDWKTSYKPKVTGTWNIHQAVQEAGISLDFFVLFGSLAAILGNPGQANYASGNSFLDSFVQYRHGLGLPCSIVDIGAIEEIGLVSKNSLETKFRNIGFTLIQEQTLMDAIVASIFESQPSNVTATNRQTAPVSANETSTVSLNPRLLQCFENVGQFAIGTMSTRSLDDPENRHPMAHDIRMALAQQLVGCSKTNVADSKSDDFKQLISAIKSDPEALLGQKKTLEKVTMAIGKALCSHMGINQDSVTMASTTTLESLGLDSLVGIEFRNWWKESLATEISVLELTNAGTLGRLGVLATDSLKQRFGVAGLEASIDTRQDALHHNTGPEGDVLRDNGVMINADCSHTLSVLDFAVALKTHVDEIALLLDESVSGKACLPQRAHVLLTGATGFLGSEILKQLLRHPDIGSVAVLIRTDSTANGLERVKKTAKIAKWWKDSDEARIEIWLGDLSRRNCGLAEHHLSRLRGESVHGNNVNAIIHNGATIKLAATYDELRATNVESTTDLLKLALAPHNSAKFLYVSGGLKLEYNAPMKDLVTQLSTHPGYSQTKFMAERITLEAAKLLGHAQDRIAVVKPGLILGAAGNGVTNLSDLLAGSIAVCGAMMSYPIFTGSPWIYMSGVDDVASTILARLLPESGEVETCVFTDIRKGIPANRFWAIVGDQLGFSDAAIPWNSWVQQATSILPPGRSTLVTETLDQVYNHYGHTMSESSVPRTDIKNTADGDDEITQIEQALRDTVRYIDETGYIHAMRNHSHKMREDVIHRGRTV